MFISFNLPYYPPFESFYFVTTICTVLFDIPKCFAACLTVALLSIIYCAINNTLSSIYSFKKIPCNTCFYIVCKGFLFIPGHYTNHSVTPWLNLGLSWLNLGLNKSLNQDISLIQHTFTYRNTSYISSPNHKDTDH